MGFTIYRGKAKIQGLLENLTESWAPDTDKNHRSIF